jgi:Tol biopolymer transport system component
MTKSLFIAATLVCAVLVSGVRVRAQSGYDLFQKALATERADGNLKDAIQLYEHIVKQFASDRALVARALVRMADCYQRLGDSESKKIWQRIVRDYADQPEPVATAHARLGDGGVKGSGMLARQVVLSDRRSIANLMISGTVSRDGRYLPFIDYGPGCNLFLRDLVTGQERQVTTDGTMGTVEGRAGRVKQQCAAASAFSKDSRQLAYGWFNGERQELRILSVASAGVPRFQRVFVQPDIKYVVPHDWTADAKAILVLVNREDGTAQIGLITVADGKLHVLKSVDWRGPTRMFISPDGKKVAFDLPADDRGEQRDIFVTYLDGSRETPVVVDPANDVVMGWSPDGQQLLFASDRHTSSAGLFAVRYSENRNAEIPRLIKPDIGIPQSIGVTERGALYYVVNATNRNYFDVKIASFDVERGRVLADPVTISADSRSSNTYPAWSPDGRYVVYSSTRAALGDGERTSLVVYSGGTREVRELHPDLNRFYSPRWSPDGTALVVSGQNRRGQWGAYRIDFRNGSTSTIVNTDVADVDWSRDGKSVYYSRRDADGQMAFISRNLATGVERELVRGAFLGDFTLSPDGQYIAVSARDVNPSTNAPSSAVVVVSVSRGDRREYLRADLPQNPPAWLNDPVGVMMWTPDSQAVLAYKFSPEPVPTMETWRVPLKGTATKLDSSLRARGRPSLHPDGKTIAFMVPSIATTSESGFQVWAIENVLPSATR